MKPRLAWLALLPIAGFLSGGMISQHAPALVFGVPFLLLWNSAWVLSTSGILTLIHQFDPNNRSEEAGKDGT